MLLKIVRNTACITSCLILLFPCVALFHYETFDIIGIVYVCKEEMTVLAMLLVLYQL